MTAALLLNPHAGGHRRNPAWLRAYQTERHLTVFRTDTLADLDHACQQIHQLQPHWLAVAGGDGTLGSAIGSLQKAYGAEKLPALLALRGGTMNMVANSVGAAGNPVQLLRRTLSTPSEYLRRVERNTLVVNQRSGFIFGLGLVSHFLEAYYEGPRTGPVKAAELVLRTTLGILRRDALYQRLFRPIPGHLASPGQPPCHTEWTAILVQTIENLGIGFRPMYRAHTEPGRFHALATDMSAAQLLRHLPHIFHGKPWATERMRDWTGDSLRFTPDSETLYTLDGELYRARDAIEVKIGIPVQFVIPAH